MSQIALPLVAPPGAGPSRIVVGSANAAVLEAFSRAEGWPFRTAVLFGPPRSGKSLLARWFVEGAHGGAEAGPGAGNSRGGEAIDDAETVAEDELFHRWNRAQESGRPLLLVSNRPDWRVTLPDLASRLGAALRLEIGEPDDAMLAGLIAIHAEQRAIVLDESAAAYLVPRCERSHIGVERLIATIDRLSLERKQPPTMAIWREALDEIGGAMGGDNEPRLL